MPTGFRSLLRCTILLGTLGCAPGLVSPAATNDSSWMRLGWLSDEGLPNNTVGGIAQTPDGFLWLGTPNGIARFDGVDFEDFESTNFISEPNRGILTMTASRGGRLWLAMDRGAVVSLGEGHREIALPLPEMETLVINALVEDSEGAVWAAYRGGSVARIKDGKFRRFDSRDGLPPGTPICSLAQDTENTMWFAKAGQLGQFQQGRFQVLAQLEGSSMRLCPARDGGIWVCSGLKLYRFQAGGRPEAQGELTVARAATEVSTLLESRDGAVWIGTTLNGLFRFDGTSFERIPTSHQEILSLCEDMEGSIWVGTGGGGLNQIRRRAIRLESSETGMSFDAAMSLAQDTNGVIWMATQDGSMARRVGGRWETVPRDANWSGDAVALVAGLRGELWIGTRSHGLQCWVNNRFVTWGGEQELKGQTVRALVAARNGDLWLGEDTPTAVQRWRGGKLEDFEVPRGIRVIRAAAEDAAGNIWFGSSKGNLMRVEGRRLVDQTTATTGTPQPIRCLYGTPDGSLWIGTAGFGLGRWKNGRFAQITAREGLYDDFISQLLADDHGWLWFGANRGIFRVRQAELEAVAERRASRVRSIHYGSGDGLPGLQANFGSAPTGLRSRDGRLWMPMRTALAVVEPAKLTDSSRPPPVLIKRVTLGERTIAAYGGIVPIATTADDRPLNLAKAKAGLRLPPDHRRLEFKFTALSFIGSENIAFRYQLANLDEQWQDAENARTAVYPRLSAGQYEFRVNARNGAGDWNEQDAVLAFVVSPFFWQTWWFRSAALTAFTALVIAIVRYVSFRRLRQQLQQLEQQAALHRERARIAKDIHDDVGASLTQISLIGELAQHDREAPGKVTEHLRRMSGTARQAVKSLDEIVWAVNPRNDTLAHFIDYTGQFALDYLRLAGLRCRLDLPEEVPARELSTEVRHNLFLVVKEAIHNTVKHAHATELRLHAKVDDEKLTIVIADNGAGFTQPPDDPTADGLRNMQQRVADIGGECWIHGRPGAGTSVTIELPWSRSRQRA